MIRAPHVVDACSLSPNETKGALIPEDVMDDRISRERALPNNRRPTNSRAGVSPLCEAPPVLKGWD